MHGINKKGAFLLIVLSLTGFLIGCAKEEKLAIQEHDGFCIIGDTDSVYQKYVRLRWRMAVSAIINQHRAERFQAQQTGLLDALKTLRWRAIDYSRLIAQEMARADDERARSSKKKTHKAKKAKEGFDQSGTSFQQEFLVQHVKKIEQSDSHEK